MIDPLEFPLIEEDELNQLIGNPMDLKKKMYCETVRSFVTTSIIQGEVDIRGKSGLFWNKKEIQLNLVTKKMKL